MIISFSEFAEFSESYAPFRKNSIVCESGKEFSKGVHLACWPPAVTGTEAQMRPRAIIQKTRRSNARSD